MGYTSGMKTAVSIPDAIFKRAEAFAKRTRRSRSRVFSDALAEYLGRHEDGAVTETMNAALAEIGDDAYDPFVSAAARITLERTQW